MYFQFPFTTLKPRWVDQARRVNPKYAACMLDENLIGITKPSGYSARFRVDAQETSEPRSPEHDEFAGDGALRCSCMPALGGQKCPREVTEKAAKASAIFNEYTFEFLKLKYHIAYTPLTFSKPLYGIHT